MHRVFRDRGFVIHLSVYMAVNVLLLLINIMTAPNKLWFYWPLVGWGVAVLGHAFAVMRATKSVDGPVTEQAGMTIKATEIEEHARRLWEAHGAKAIAEAAQKAGAFEKAGDEEQARTWRRIEAALIQMSGPRES